METIMPEEVGFSSERLGRIRPVMQAYVEQQKLPGLLTLVARRGKVVHFEKFGLMDIIMSALREERTTVMFIEHDMEIVERYVSRVLAFYQGEIICDAATDEALADAKVKEFVLGKEYHSGRAAEAQRSDFRAADAGGSGHA